MKRWLFFWIIFWGLTSYSQTGVLVSYYAGNSQQYNIETSGKLYFSDDDLIVQTSSNSGIISIPVSIISKITFTEFLSNETFAADNTSKLIIYPNPGNQFIKIHHSSESDFDIVIYSIYGQKIKSGHFSSDESIDINDLSTGWYFVKVNNTTLKFLKQ